MITDNPEIIPDGKGLTNVLVPSEIFIYGITCPVCENETRFWREKPFPTDVKSDTFKLRVTLKASTRFGDILQEEIDKAEEAGHKIVGIELPKLSSFGGLPITYY